MSASRSGLPFVLPSGLPSRWLVAAAGSALLTFSAASAAHAAPIPGLFSTGVDDTGAPLAAGATDPHYVLTSADPSFPGPDAFVVVPDSTWTADTGTSAWISIQPSTQGNASQLYVYTTTFSLSGDPSTVTLSGRWACAHSCTVSLNGTLVATSANPAWATMVSFSVPAGGPFVSGTNTLAFAVASLHGRTGLQVAGLGSASVGCNVDTDCPTAEWCDEKTFVCLGTLANGAPMPVDINHTNPTLDGTCSSAAAALVCASGVCSISKNLCGYAVGEGPCTDGSVCVSGACSVNGNCMPTGGCNVDGDCSTGFHCDVGLGSCIAPDAGVADAGVADAGVADAGVADAEIADAAAVRPDASSTDAIAGDFAVPFPDGSAQDTGTGDASTPPAGTPSNGCTCNISAQAPVPAPGVFIVFAAVGIAALHPRTRRRSRRRSRKR
jgi:hypothetical protein